MLQHSIIQIVNNFEVFLSILKNNIKKKNCTSNFKILLCSLILKKFYSVKKKKKFKLYYIL